MKKNLIITVLLLVYTVTFILLFVRLRNLSGPLLEELSERYVYYILGFMFIVGLTPTLYMIMEATNKKFSLSMQEESESIHFDNDIELKKKAQQKNTEGTAHLDGIKAEIATAFKQGTSLQGKLDKAIWKLSNHFEISQALIYTKVNNQLSLQTSYAFIVADNDPRHILSGEGLTGQAVKDGNPYFIKDIPEGYLKVISGLGESLPKSLLIIPCTHNGEVQTVFELSSLKEYSKQTFDEIVLVCNYFSELINQ